MSVHDVSGQPIGPIRKGQAVHDLDSLKTSPTGCPETSSDSTPNQSWVTSQKSEEMAEACNHAL